MPLEQMKSFNGMTTPAMLHSVEVHESVKAIPIITAVLGILHESPNLRHFMLEVPTKDRK